MTAYEQRQAAIGRAIAKHGDGIRGRMQAMGAKNWSDAEIERCLGPCVCGPFLIKVAMEMVQGETERCCPALAEREAGV